VDLVDVTILALRLALAVVLYAFLWLVVRSAWRTVRAAPVLVDPSPAQRRAARLRLLVLEAGESDLAPGEVLEVPDGATLGRSERATLVLADSAVSAEHARFILHAGQWRIADLGSTNGTLLNQTLVDDEAALASGDVLGLGSVRLQVVGR
jgi:pSer/pThr/pTyr-binding forkhead associated (FHA) protein